MDPNKCKWIMKSIIWYSYEYKLYRGLTDKLIGEIQNYSVKAERRKNQEHPARRMKTIYPKLQGHWKLRKVSKLIDYELNDTILMHQMNLQRYKWFQLINQLNCHKNN